MHTYARDSAVFHAPAYAESNVNSDKGKKLVLHENGKGFARFIHLSAYEVVKNWLIHKKVFEIKIRFLIN